MEGRREDNKVFLIGFTAYLFIPVHKVVATFHGHDSLLVVAAALQGRDEA